MQRGHRSGLRLGLPACLLPACCLGGSECAAGWECWECVEVGTAAGCRGHRPQPRTYAPSLTHSLLPPTFIDHVTFASATRLASPASLLPGSSVPRVIRRAASLPAVIFFVPQLTRLRLRLRLQQSYPRLCRHCTPTDPRTRPGTDNDRPPRSNREKPPRQPASQPASIIHHGLPRRQAHQRR